MNKFILPLTLLLAVACNRNKIQHDASGTFEAVETIVSAEGNGRILALNVQEGDMPQGGTIVGYIDSTQLCLQRNVLVKNQKAIRAGMPDIRIQLQALEEELDNAVTDRNRIQVLVKGNVASQKQLDDANARVATLKAKTEAQRSMLQKNTGTLSQQEEAVQAQLNQLNDQILRCRILNPLSGTVLERYAEAGEHTGIGKPLYKIANLEYLSLRAYVTGDQYAQLKLGQTVKVFTDEGKDASKEYKGTIEWISNKAEFTPKTIQTKDERANLVYAIKIRVKNDGFLKIGMYGEMGL